MHAGALEPEFILRDLKFPPVTRHLSLVTPPASTAAGRAAKAFVETLVHVGDEILVSTTKPDKYDRYLADVFVGRLRAESSELSDRTTTPISQPSALNSQPAFSLFLNNALLKSRHAIRYDGGAKEE